MPIRTKFLLVSLVFSVPTILSGIATVYLVNKASAPLEQEIPRQVSELSRSSKLSEKALYIRYYDEVLTQSARNYAFTGNVDWKERYLATVPKLDKVILEATESGDPADRQDFESISQANLMLIDLETQAMNLVENDQPLQAQATLDSQTYAEQKANYQAGLMRYAQRRGLALDEAVAESSSTLQEISQKIDQLTTTGFIGVGVICGLSILLCVVLSLVVSRLVTKPLKQIGIKAQDIAKGKFGELLDITTHDEIGELAQSINSMSKELHDAKNLLESKVAERTQELEKLNKFMVDRELKMIELKDRLRQEGGK